ncbi:MAG: hypothetical protein HN337_08195 [Deltaproteobacteria bacterium]|nr:hypothetical protein [Deltaproteobacteria bacterium]
MEALGVLLLGPLLYKIFFMTNEGWLDKSLFCTMFLLYAFIRFCATKKWYPPEAPRYSGIELHFKKALVPVGYILAIFGIFGILFDPTPFLISEVILFIIIGHVDVILIYIHRKDNDPTPVNAFSGH